ncbi:hypothetical protein AYO46_00910 [Betaproteobacteria bacterium SCGC AG-212-J23]|nr:hypothetical protein AYO46_00910 [Betaproteobacteria bacterium SCGC AG-212-J23]
MIGHFLLKGKHKIIDWCAERKEVSDRTEVKQLETELETLAKDTDVKVLPAYTPVHTPTLLADISQVKNALSVLSQDDNATLSSSEGVSQYNKDLMVSEEVVRDLVTRERLSTVGERILKVKKPDYLGTSKWTFRYGSHIVEAKVTDASWLTRFQSNLELVHPGDSLRVLLYEQAAYGEDNELIHTEVEVQKVLEVIRGSQGAQGRLLDS